MAHCFISEIDVLEAIESGKDLSKLRAEDIMSKSPIAVPIAKLVDPIQAAEGHVAILVEERHIASPFPRLVEGYQIQDGSIGRTVVRRVRNLVEVGELPNSELVGHLAGFGVSPSVELRGLVLGEPGQRST